MTDTNSWLWTTFRLILTLWLIYAVYRTRRAARETATHAAWTDMYRASWLHRVTTMAATPATATSWSDAATKAEQDGDQKHDQGDDDEDLEAGERGSKHG